jgi:hypothetical protein
MNPSTRPVGHPSRSGRRAGDERAQHVPKGWEVKKLGEIAENFDRLRKPLSKMQRAKVQGEYPYYGAAKVFDYLNDFIFDGEYLLMAEDGSVFTTERARSTAGQRKVMATQPHARLARQAAVLDAFLVSRPVGGGHLALHHRSCTAENHTREYEPDSVPLRPGEAARRFQSPSRTNDSANPDSSTPNPNPPPDPRPAAAASAIGSGGVERGLMKLPGVGSAAGPYLQGLETGVRAE